MFDHLSTATLIARGRELNALIDRSETELKQIETILRSRALAMPHEPLAEGYREGRRARLREDDQALSVIFESDVLKASFAAECALATTIRQTVNDEPAFIALFKLKSVYERRVSDGHKFRLAAKDLLPAGVADTVIDQLKDRDRNGIVKSKSVIEWRP